MSRSLQFTTENVDLAILEQAIRDTGRPLHITQLAKTALRAYLQSTAERRYVPGASYTQGEHIYYNDGLCIVRAVRRASNPVQGQFTVLTLEFPDGSLSYMAAEVSDPVAPTDDRMPIPDRRVDGLLDGPAGVTIRQAVGEALAQDECRFVWSQDDRGDFWCLKDLLPEITPDHLSKVAERLSTSTILSPISTADLVLAVWGIPDDGSDSSVRHAFALNAELHQCQDVRWMGKGWILESEWQSFQQRQPLIGPRQRNLVQAPPGLTPVSSSANKLVEEDEEPEPPAQVPGGDYESWRLGRAKTAVIVLQPKHYYSWWLPLTADMLRLFPPFESGSCQVTFHYQFGAARGAFPAWVDYPARRVLGNEAMYNAFYENGVYPGAKLRITRHENFWDYDICTLPVPLGQSICVRRVLLGEDGQLEYVEDPDPVRYEVDKDVFVAAARWEDLPALFDQAERVGAGIFQLMYQNCRKWWEQGGRRELRVTARQLFNAIHYGQQGRLTSMATIQWELWRRAAFQPLGQGVYRFRPEYVDRLCISFGRSPSRSTQPQPARTHRRPRPKRLLAPTPDLWARLRADAGRMSALESAVRTYMAYPGRQAVLLFRRLARQRIRRLLARDVLDRLTLDEFNAYVWQIGVFAIKAKPTSQVTRTA